MENSQNELDIEPLGSPSFDQLGGGSIPLEVMQRNENVNHNSTSSAGGLFFADMHLDLDEAHEIAETPEAAKPVLGKSSSYDSDTARNKLTLPSLGSLQDYVIEEEDQEATSPVSSFRDKQDFSRISHFEVSHPPKSPPRMPRDVPWGIAFILIVPASLIRPILMEEREQISSRLTRYPLSTATIHALCWAGVSAWVLSRFMYRTVAGGEGDNERHVIAQALTMSAPISVLVYIALAVIIWFECPDIRLATLIPVWYTVRDVFLFRRWKRSIQEGSTSRHTFFQALVCMALDILSRSLRRSSFFRVLSGVLFVQFLVLVLWRWAILGALGAGSYWTLIVAALGGKWASGTVARLLSLVASGGVTGWMLDQSILAQNLPETEPTDDNSPDAYSSVVGSVYRGVDMEDVYDDDDFDLEEDLETPSGRRPGSDWSSNSTVRSVLLSGLTTSFGSVAECGLLGGPAQFIWSQIRKVEIAKQVISNERNHGDFRGMEIGTHEVSLLTRIWIGITTGARNFVRTFSDLAMPHVAAYYKSYQRAAKDVAHLIEQSGVEAIIHDDISTHICSCVGGVVSGIIVILTGHVLLQQRKNASEPVSDVQILENMLLAFVLSYTMIFTVMEPLRASIKAVYVSFAQHPRGLSQAFPLIYHRLTRLSGRR